MILFFNFRGFHNVELVYFENLPFEVQLNLIHCTDLLIGVQGAGLQW